MTQIRERMEEMEIPNHMKKIVEERKLELVEKLAEVDPEIEDKYLNNEIPTSEELKKAIRRNCVTNKFTPVFCGSALKNFGVQLLLDGVVNYLPSPVEVYEYR
jgi:elongation factor G